MGGLSRWFIHNPVAANLIMLLILVTGLLTLVGIRIEGFPKLPADTVSITTTFSNAYTQQVDEQITQKIEQALTGLDGVKKMTSVSADGYSQVRVQKNTGTDLQRLLDDIRLRIDGLATLPKAAEKPIISRNDFDLPALYILLDGPESDPRTLQELTRQTKEKLLEQPEISRLKILGEREPEIRIEVPPHLLEKYDLTLLDITDSIQRASLLFESGMLKTQDSHITLRADSQAYYKADFAAIPVLKQPNGNQVLLGDIATISDTYEDNDTLVRFNGQPALGIEVLIGRKENLLVIADVVHKVLDDIRQTLPGEINVSIFGDTSVFISDRLNLLTDNALQGLALVALLLALFLDVRLAFWVAMGIPISIAGALAMMGSSWIDYSLNDITTFGMIIALGILVDDAVVVGESVFDARNKIPDPLEGTASGVERVATATIFGVLTTIAAFSPMMMIDNAMGKVLATFSGVVVLALAFSLLESKFILPAHLAHISLAPPKNLLLRGWSYLQRTAQNGLAGFRDNLYAPAVEWAIQQRYAVFVTFIALAILGFGMIVQGKVRTLFFPEIPGQYIGISMEMDARAPYSLAQNNLEQMVEIGQTLNQYYVEKGITDIPPIQHIIEVMEDAGNGQIFAELVPSGKRPNLDTLTLMREWQSRTGKLEGTNSLTFQASEEMAGGFEIQLFSKNPNALQDASEAVMNYLANIEGIYNLRDSLKGGQPEIHLSLKPESQHLGFSAQDLALQIGSRFGGAEVQRIQRNNQEVKVKLQNSADARNTLEDLMQTRIKSQQGHWYPLLSVANVSSRYGNAYLERRNGQRTNTIQAFVDKSATSPGEIGQGLFKELVPTLKARYPDVTISESGELEEMQSIKGGLIKALILASLLIYVLMAIPLKSYIQPFIIMSVIPFGFIGATLGHWIMDLPLSLLSFFGMLALTGVVVNDSLVMMTRYNQAREEGENVHDALQSAGVGRFRAIFLTTATTVAGLMPLMAESSEQAQYLIPAAVSLAYGEIFATLITLIFIPVLIAILEDFRALKLTNSSTGSMIPGSQQETNHAKSE